MNTLILRIVGIPESLKVRWHRELPAVCKPKSATLSRRDGKWFVCIQFETTDIIESSI